MKKNIKIGLCGLGTVGAGVATLLQKNAQIIQTRTGLDINIVQAATIDPYDHLDVDFSNIKVTDSVDDILNNPEIDVMVELIGGTGIAKKIVLDAFDKGKSVVTANKALLAKHSQEIFSAAYGSKGLFGYEASVGGGIPIIRNIREGFSGDKIDGFSGIINGTGNYILSAMTNERTDFKTALKQAQDKGYAEADPTFDIEGIDTAHKVIILMELAFNALFDFDQLYIEGITGIEPIDIDLADELGYRIKLLGKALNTERGFEGRVHPALVKKDSMLASVQGAFNAISVFGNFVGHTMSYGAGAGSFPTASAVVADIIEIGRVLSIDGANSVQPLGVPFERLKKMEIIPVEEIETEYYLRFNIKNNNQLPPEIENILSKNHVNIQQELKSNQTDAENSTSFVLITQTAKEKDVRESLKIINSLPFMASPIKLIRVDP